MNQKNNFMNWDKPGTALITGASSGIGAEFARRLASQGFKTILVARRKEKMEALAQEIQNEHSTDVEILTGDLTQSKDVETIMSRMSELDDLDVLINNAGFGFMTDFLNTPLQGHQDMINVHCTVPVQLCYAAVPGMTSRGRGAIINLSSIVAIVRTSLSIMYTSTKEFLNVFSQILKANLKDTGIKVQSLCPGFTYTEFHDLEGMNGFDRGWFPKEWWMTAEEVVSLSLDAFENDTAICVPGKFNQDMVSDYLSNIKDLKSIEIK